MENNTYHPDGISKKLIDALRSFSAEAEKIKSLHSEQLAIIYEQGWFKLFVPKIYGGLELSLPEALKMEEALAWVDGSLGWTVTLCSGANWFVGFIEKEIAKNIFTDTKVCLAGSGKPSGTAKIMNEGYEITGHWNYATGSVHATVFTANCLIEKDGAIVQNEDGSPMIKAFLLLKEEVTIHKKWDYIGMVATSSNSFEVKAVKVPSNRVFIIDKKHSVLSTAIYQYPFLHFAEATLAVNSAGMAFRFIELYKNYQRDNPREIDLTMRLQLKETEDLFKNIRQNFYAAIEESWKAHCANDSTSALKMEILSQISRAMATTARKLVDELYPYCGLAAADSSSEINRVWRNFHTASQHPLLLSYTR
ncbi:MAG TPA: hypothetical protein VK718_11180 [Ferruginibacter sp.]|jgi:alkylation response protein AidB-like acyl-CoA dehydrogenase|nr:hypothetical protein [Ferruginibacter sp.]